jgi:hypothetical protein
VRLRRRVGGRVGRQDAGELLARDDVQLGEYLAQVILDGAGLINSRVPISGFERPSAASLAISAS